MKKTVLWVMVLAVLLTMGTGVLFAGGRAEVEKDPDDLHVALIVKNLTNPFFVYMMWGGEAAANKHGVRYTCLAPEVDGDVEGQIRIMEDLIQQDVDAIIVVPIDSFGIIAGIERANRAGIPVLVSNTMAFGGDFVSFAGIDHITTAEAIAQYMVDRLGGSGRVIELEGVTGAQTSIDRGVGIANILKQNPGIEVVARQTANYNRAQGMRVTEDLMVSHDNIDAIIAYNDAMALGAVEALSQMGKLDDVMVFGIDAIRDALDSVRRGELTATVDSDPVSQAFAPVEAAILYVRDGIVPPAEMIVGSGVPSVVDQASVDAFEKQVRDALAAYGVRAQF